MANIETTAFAKINFAEGAAAGTPSAATSVIYVKADGKIYAKDDAGTEYDLTAGTALGAWTAYTPTWANGGTTNLGNGTLVGRYKALDANTYAIQISLAWGSTTSVTGAGSWSFSLPAGLTSRADVTQILAGHVLDGGTDNKLCVGKLGGSATTIAEVIPEGGNTVTGTVPMTWANTDQLNLTGTIEVA